MQLEYNVAYHLHCQVVLRSGRAITLEGLHQTMTYAGLLEGTPDAESNDWHMNGALRDPMENSMRGVKPALISPPRRDYLRSPGDMARIGSPHHIPEWLPMVTCIGSFKSITTARDSSKDLSVLTVVWF